MTATQRHFGPYSFETSNENKVLFPDSHLTKGDLMEYYDRVADVMLPHLRDRPLTHHRYPDGIDGDDFFQKSADGLPEWLDRVTVETEAGPQSQILCQNKATLVYLGQMATITPHVWSSRCDRLHHPDQMILDLDPTEGADHSGGGFETVRWAALCCRRALEEELGLACYAKLTGSRGLHVVVPLDRTGDFDDVRAFAQRLARLLAARHPEHLTVEQRKTERAGRLYLDTTRNAYGQTVVAPYAPRARPGAPVAAPVSWREVEDGHVDSRSFGIESLPRRIRDRPDPWAAMRRHAHPLRIAGEKLDAIVDAGR